MLAVVSVVDKHSTYSCRGATLYFYNRCCVSVCCRWLSKVIVGPLQWARQDHLSLSVYFPCQDMIHGATTKWMQYVPFSICQKKPQSRLPVMLLCVTVIVIFLLSATYYSSFPVVGQFHPVEYETFRNACVEQTNTSANFTVLKPANYRKIRLNTTGFQWNDTRLDILHMVSFQRPYE